MSEAKKALKGMPAKNVTYVYGPLWIEENYETLTRALMVLDAVDGDRFLFDLGDEGNGQYNLPTYRKGNNDLLERLKGIGHDENR